MNATNNGKSLAPPSAVALHYIKSNNFRVVHCDGIWGGLTPRGNIAMNCFSERAAIPTKVEHELTSTGSLGEEISRESKEGVVREIEVELLMDVNMAKSVLVWLTDRIKEAEDSFVAKERGQ